MGKMVSEKTPALYLNKVALSDDRQKEIRWSKSTISWICAIILVVLLIILSVEFLYPCFEQSLRYEEKDIHMLEEQPVRVINAGNSGSILKDKKPTAGNPWDFDFLLDPPNLCITRNPPNSHEYEQDPEIKLLMLVPSAPDHFEQRSTIRNTWGSIAEKPLGPMRLGFVLGTTNNITVNDRVREESVDFRDIIQADFDDNFYHQTTKSVFMLKWVAKKCPHAQFFLKADDDTFVNLATIADILGTEPFLSEKKFIGGNIRSGVQSTQTQQEQPFASGGKNPFREYPPYAKGSAYVMTGPTAIDLFDASMEVEPFLPQEDVFLTGLCAEFLDVPRIHDPRFTCNGPPNPPTWDSFSTLATAHSVTPDIMDLIWNDMTRTMLSTLNHFASQEMAFNSTFHLRKKRHL